MPRPPRPPPAPSRLPVVGALLLACAACQQVPLAPIDAARNGERIAARTLTDSAVQGALARHELA
ncbi:MAG TPA: hypothetical protein VMU03_17295, partial [Gammaproteobacteria bacterium]|nr:hypothetical protein [Gammaproteobacteria bacterium]